MYLLSLEAIDPNGGAAVVSLTEEARSSDDLVRAIRALTSRLRVRLGESLPAVTRSKQTLMKATTPSLRALQLLSAGVDRIDSEVAISDPRGAEDLFRTPWPRIRASRPRTPILRSCCCTGRRKTMRRSARPGTH